MKSENNIQKVQLSMVADDDARDEIKAALQVVGIELEQEDRMQRYEMLRVVTPGDAPFETEYLQDAVLKMQTALQAFVFTYRQREPEAGAFTIRVHRLESFSF